MLSALYSLHQINTIRLVYEPVTGRIAAAHSENNSGLIDDYETILAQLGEYAQASVYKYYQAVDLLHSGHSAMARQVYET